MSANPRQPTIGDIRRLRFWTGKGLSQTTVLDLERFAVALSQSGLAKYFRWTHSWLLRNDRHLPDRILPAGDVRRMIRLEQNLRNRALLLLPYGTGLQVSEACGLRWRDINLLADPVQFAFTGKGRRSRTILLPHSVASELIRLGDDCGLTESFCNRGWASPSTAREFSES